MGLNFCEPIIFFWQNFLYQNFFGPNQTYQTKPSKTTKLNSLYQTHQTKFTIPNRPNWIKAQLAKAYPELGTAQPQLVSLSLRKGHFQKLFRNPFFATLSSILDFQLSWKSGKFQLARWSYEVGLFPEETTHPPDHTDFSCWIDTSLSLGNLGNVCRVSEGYL